MHPNLPPTPREKLTEILDHPYKVKPLDVEYAASLFHFYEERILTDKQLTLLNNIWQRYCASEAPEPPMVADA